MSPLLVDVDPFDLPEWLGLGDVVWRSEAGLDTGHLVTGLLSGDEGETLACGLLAVDEAYPQPVTDDASRLRVHQAWRHGQVHLATHDDALVLALPGSRLTPDLVLEAVGRLARAVGARPERFAVLLRVGG